MPTYHLATCADDADLRISHIIRGQEHLSNTFKHMLIFDAAGAESPTFAHLPLLMAPDGTKLSKRVHGPVVSVTTYRDAGFLPQAFINFLCLLGWSPKNDREKMSREETVELFTLEGINRSQRRGQLHRGRPLRRQGPLAERRAHPFPAPDELARELLPFAPADLEKLRKITPLIQERMQLLRDVQTVADFFFADQLPPYDSAELIPKKGDAAMAQRVLRKACEVLAAAEFSHDGLESALRAAAVRLGIKAGQMFEPDPRRRLRAQDRAAAVRHPRSAGPRDLPGAHRAGHRKSTRNL